MAKPVKPSRPYRSELRAEQVGATRDRVVTAARELFIERGFAATTIRAVATGAGVAEMTVYTGFGDKRGLLEAVIRSAIGGANYVPEPKAFDAISELPTPRQRLRAWVELSCAVLARTSPIHAVIRGAADKAPFAAELRVTLLNARLQSQRQLVRTYLGDALRPGLTYNDAAERHCALTSPELHHLLTIELGWSQRRHTEWLADILDRELLGA